NAKVQAKHAVDTAKQEVDKSRQGDDSGYGDSVDSGYAPDSEVPTSSMFGTGGEGTPDSSASDGLGADVPNTHRTA
ncbi:MAG TPA: hypothetical protein VK894_04455, partial [Jiangellales bacterium]|nr:hypothetical protein [Jiangellales bacterium]